MNPADRPRSLQDRTLAYQAQVRVLEGFLARARRRGAEALQGAMQSALDVVADMTGAAAGSLFLFDDAGQVAETLLARRTPDATEARKLVGCVLQGGLAGWVRRHRRAGLIADIRRDPRWLALENEPLAVRSALAVPLLREHALLGILTLMHPAPGHFQASNLRLIQATADQMALALENARLYDRLEAACREAEAARRQAEETAAALDRQLAMGRRIQQDFLPAEGLDLPGWVAVTRFVPALQVSGDFYDFFPLPGGRLGWSVGDVCDKGVGAALYMGLFRSLIRVFAGQAAHLPDGAPRDGGAAASGASHPALAAVDHTNRYVADHHSRMGVFATLLFGVLDLHSGRLDYVNAGHPSAYLLGAGGLKARLTATGPAVGLTRESAFGVGRLHLDPGDILLAHTDGVTEACNPAGDFFGRDRLEGLLSGGPAAAVELVQALLNHLETYAGGAPQADDITILGLQRLAPPRHPGPRERVTP